MARARPYTGTDRPGNPGIDATTLIAVEDHLLALLAPRGVVVRPARWWFQADVHLRVDLRLAHGRLVDGRLVERKVRTDPTVDATVRDALRDAVGAPFPGPDGEISLYLPLDRA